MENIRHRYGRGFPQSRLLQPDDFPDVDEENDNDDGIEGATKGVPSSQLYNLLHDVTIDQRAKAFIVS